MREILNRVTAFIFPISANEKLKAIDFSQKFVSLSINKNLTDKITMNRVIQLEDTNHNISQYVLFTENNETRFEFYKKNSLVSFSKNQDDILNLDYIDKITELFDFSIGRSKELLRNGSEVASDINSETKGLEWIKVSLIVLKSAINKAMEDQTLSFDGQFFCGQRTPDEDYQMRIQCLSLDFLLEFISDGRLRVSAWNYKNLEPDPTASPTFIAEFVMIKQKVFDEFIELLVLMSRATTKISK
mgnify:CR=1 FL=1